VPPGWRPPSRWFESRLQALNRAFSFRERNDYKQRLGGQWAFGVMELMGWLDFDHPERWPDYTTPELARHVAYAIRHTGRISHYLACLLPNVDAVVNATQLPIALFPPPLPGVHVA
jgi:hypothetical protein